MVRAIHTDEDDGIEPAAAPSPGRGVAPGLLRIARPKQWIKNLLVFAAPGAAGVLTHGAILGRACAAFGIFCLAASGTYFLNDVLDAAADRHHPVKRHRPVASGLVDPRLALTGAGVLMAASLGLAWWLTGHRLVIVMALYVAVSSAYSVRLKHEPVVDLAGLSSGFILRAVAGGVATGVPLSDWFVIVASFGSLLVAAGKRSAEHVHLGDSRALHRPVLEEYPPMFLRFVRLLAAAVTVTAYCLWAFERSATIGPRHHPIWFELSILPVVMTVLHLELRFERGRGGAPEELALHDHMLQAFGVLWVVLFAVGLYR